jgi:hypothetical protein
MSAIYRVIISAIFITSFFSTYSGQQEIKRWTREKLELYLEQPQCDLGEATRQLIAIALSGGCLRSTINRVGEQLQKCLIQSTTYAHEKTIVRGLLESSVRLQIDHAMSLDYLFFYEQAKPKGTIVHYAAYTGNHPLIESIMKIEPEKALLVKDEQGNSPVHVATMAGRPGTVELLMRLRFNANESNANGKKPEHLIPPKRSTDSTRLKQLLCNTIVCSQENKDIQDPACMPVISIAFLGTQQPVMMGTPAIVCSSNKKRGNPPSGCLFGFLKCMSIQVD